MTDGDLAASEELEMFTAIDERLDWQRHDAQIQRVDDCVYMVFPQKRLMAKESWAQIFASSMRDSGYTVEYLPKWWGTPAVRISR